MAGPLGFGSPNIFGAGNPIGAWVDPRRNQLQGLAAGLLAGDPGEAFRYSMAGAQTDASIAKDKAQEIEKASQQNLTTKWLNDHGYYDLAPLVEAGQGGVALQEAVRRMQPGYGAGGGIAQDATTRAALADQYGLTGEDKTAFVLTGDLPSGRGASAEVSLQPTWLTDQNGNAVLGQMTKGGQVIPTKLPDGSSVMDPRQLAGVRSAGTIDGKTQATAQAALPNAQLTADQTIKTINQLRNDQQGIEETFGRVAGMYPQQWSPAIPGTKKADYAALLNQAKGKVFLQAYQSLRGGGAITEIEGLKAEQALARLDTAQSKEAYLRALDDFEQAVRDGLSKLQSVANGNGSALPMGGNAMQPSANDPLGIR